MGTELITPFVSVVVMVLALLVASSSSAIFHKKHSVVDSAIFGLCIGAIVLLPGLYFWKLS